MVSIFPQLLDYQFYAPTLLRLGLAAVFIVHGYPKLFSKKMPDGSRRGGIAQLATWFSSVGIKPSTFWAVVVGVVECVGGVFLVVGFLVQPVALLLAINMVVAIWKVKFKMGFVNGWEFDLVLLVMTLALAILGPGAYAIDLPF